jgi:hypothetical protein
MMDGDAVTIEQEALRWPGVTSAPGRFGAVAFRYEKRESGHIHRDRIADLPVTPEMHEGLLKGGSSRPHRVGAKGYVSYPPYGIKKTSRRQSRSSAGTTTAQNPPPVARFVVEAGKRRR